jgi:hypothetical protein
VIGWPGAHPKAWQCKAAHEKQNWINTPNSIIIRGLLSIIMYNESPAPFTQNAKFAVSNCRMSQVALLTPTRFLPSSSPWKQKEHIVPQLRSSLSLLRQPGPTASISSSSVSVLVIVHSHFLFFSFLFLFRVAGVSSPLSAILLLISSKGPGV